MATNDRDPLEVGEWITVHTPHGAEVTLYRNAEVYRVTAIDCYTRRLREPESFINEQGARDLARRWSLELLYDAGWFDISTRRQGTIERRRVEPGNRTK